MFMVILHPLSLIRLPTRTLSIPTEEAIESMQSEFNHSPFQEIRTQITEVPSNAKERPKVL